jgi:hypothetical protein
MKWDERRCIGRRGDGPSPNLSREAGEVGERSEPGGGKRREAARFLVTFPRNFRAGKTHAAQRLDARFALSRKIRFMTFNLTHYAIHVWQTKQACIFRMADRKGFYAYLDDRNVAVAEPSACTHITLFPRTFPGKLEALAVQISTLP